MFHSAYLALFHSGKSYVNGLDRLKMKGLSGMLPRQYALPRLRAEMPKGDVEVLNPPQEPSKPQMSWLGTLLPPILMGTSMLVISRVSGYNNPIYVAATMLVSFGTIPISLTTYFSQKKKYKKDCENRLNRYTEYINKLRNDFDEKREQQKILCMKYIQI